MDSDKTIGEVYNLGSELETSILELAERVKRLADSASPITFIPYQEAYGDNFEDMPRRVPSLEKIQAAIGWEPLIGLDETLASVIEYERSLTTQPA
jgi:UDP-glucose 4-epimerase